MSLVLYSSSDSDEEDEKKNSKHFKSSSSDNDRIRLFPHEIGNWALSIYIEVQCSSHLDTMIDDIIEIFDDNWKRLSEFHISLSKTFPIRFLHIESIRKNIQHELSISRIFFSTRIENVTILTNEDGSTYVVVVFFITNQILYFYFSDRSFLVFTLDQHREFSKLVEIIDKILHEHRYPGYYEVNNNTIKINIILFDFIESMFSY
jgi:hypothetical protein